jgi:tetratricopeptide (TPR) repeat protein
MNKDSVLFAVIGLLGGFIAGYLTHEAVADRQPARLANSTAGPTAALPGTAPSSAAPSGSGAGVAGAPAMEEILKLREHVERNPDDAEAILRLAHLNFDISNWDRARELYERHVALRGPNPDVLTDLGVAYRELGQTDLALATFGKAQGLNAQHWQSLFNQIVVVAFDQKNYPEADRLLVKLRELQPANPAVGELAAEVGRRRGNG